MAQPYPVRAREHAGRGATGIGPVFDARIAPAEYDGVATAPLSIVAPRRLGETEVAVYPIPDPAVGDQVMAALVLRDGAGFDPARFAEFLSSQTDLGPKQWPAYVRVCTELPRTETFKVLKRHLSAEATACADPVHPVPRSRR